MLLREYPCTVLASVQAYLKGKDLEVGLLSKDVSRPSHTEAVPA